MPTLSYFSAPKQPKIRGHKTYLRLQVFALLFFHAFDQLRALPRSERQEFSLHQGVGVTRLRIMSPDLIPLKFVRSPFVGAMTGMFIIRFSTCWFLVALAAVGSERVVVELYKTFLKRQVRGMHAGKPILYPVWLARREVSLLCRSISQWHFASLCWCSIETSEV